MQESIKQEHIRQYSPTEVGMMLGVKTSTVYAWISRRELRALKVGHSRLISLQHIKEFIEFRRTREFIDYTYTNGPIRTRRQI
jgi:excisionase family DNA binding protein